MKLTQPTKLKDIKRHWHKFDVAGQILGRSATQIAQLLMGKSKPYFVRHLDCGDYVVVINAGKVAVTGKKLTQKIYTSYSGYPGGLKKENLAHLLQRRPTQVVFHAVSGMLPKNKLRDKMLTRLYVFADEKHPYQKKFHGAR